MVDTADNDIAGNLAPWSVTTLSNKDTGGAQTTVTPGPWSPSSIPQGGAHQLYSNMSQHNDSDPSRLIHEESLTREPPGQSSSSLDYDMGNILMGSIASLTFLLITAGLLLGIVGLQRYLRRRNQTLSEDTGVFSPRRGSKAGLDMIDNQVVSSVVLCILYVQTVSKYGGPYSRKRTNFSPGLNLD